MTVPGGDQRLGILPRRPRGHCGASVVAALAVINRMEVSVKLTDTQLVLLSAASQRDDRALERPSNLKDGVADKVVAKLLKERLIAEVPSRGSLPVWRRDEDRPRSLRITKKGLAAIQVEDEASGSAEPAKKRPLGRRTGVSPQGTRQPTKAWENRTSADSRRFQAGQRDRDVEPPTGNNDRGHHEGDRVATALGARLLRRRSPKEARPHPRLGEARWRAGVSHRQPADSQGQGRPHRRVIAGPSPRAASGTAGAARSLPSNMRVQS